MNNLQRGIYQPLADKVPIYDLADEDPEEERSRAPLLVVIALVVLAAFAGVVWIAYNQGVERGRQGASLVITAPEGPVRVAPPQSAPPTPLNVYKEPVSPEQEAKTSTLAQPKSATEAPPIRLGQAANPAPAATPAPAAAPAPRPAPAAPAAPAAQPRPAPPPAAAAPSPAATAPPPAATAQAGGRAVSGA